MPTRPLASALAALAALAFIGTAAHAQRFEQGLGDPRLLSPAGLGPSYSGLTGASVGLASKKQTYGIAAGDFILQPRFFVEGSYRTNFFRVDSRNGDAEGVMSLHLRPGVALFNPKFKNVAVSLGLDVDVWLPFGSEPVTDQRNVGGNLRLAVALFPKSALTLTLHEEFKRTLWTRPQFSTNANRIRNKAGAKLSFHPGGRALDFTLDYTYHLVSYDDIDVFDTEGHELRFLASWRFFPLTYAFLEATLSVDEYSRKATEAESQADGNYVPGMPVKALLGLSGYITERLALLVRAGYGNSMLDRGSDDFSSFIGQLQASYRVSAKSIVHAGVARDFTLAPLGGDMGYVRFYASFGQRIGTIVDLNLDISYDLRDYGTWDPAPVETSTGTAESTASDAQRSEGYLRAGALLDFDVSKLFGVTLGYRFESLITDFNLTRDGNTTFVGYDDHRVFASLNLRY